MNDLKKAMASIRDMKNEVGIVNKQITVVGLTAPLGTEISKFRKQLSSLVRDEYGAVAHEVKLSDLIRINYEKEMNDINDGDDAWITILDKKIKLGNRIREDYDRNEIFGEYALLRVLDCYKAILSSDNSRHIIIIDQFKRIEEVQYLQDALGKGFWLIAVDSPLDKRVLSLTEGDSSLTEKAHQLIFVDENEEKNTYGQRMKNTFLQSHVVLKDSFETQTVSRFLDLLFSTHKETPEKDEYFMNLAFTSALKAGDLSRQVGAVIVSSCSDQISCGANEVNKFKGGSYWGSDSGHRDLDEKKDPNKEVISTIKDTLRQRIGKLGLTGDQIETLIGDTRIDDLTEFHRATHAEMDAILSAHRNGTPVRGSTLYCTTFPCHNCAKHIVSAGVERVVYLEPYAKSLATDLHFDSISKSKEENKVHFDCFHGVTHLRFKDLFSTNYSSGSVIERKSAENVVPEYIRSEASLRFTIWNKLLENLGKIVLDTFTPDGVIKIEKVVNGD